MRPALPSPGMVARLMRWTMCDFPLLSRERTWDSDQTRDSIPLMIAVSCQGVPGVPPKTSKSFWCGGSVRKRAQGGSLESFYSTRDTWDTLDMGKKTKGCWLPPVQGVPGGADSAATRPRPPPVPPSHAVPAGSRLSDPPRCMGGGVTGPWKSPSDPRAVHPAMSPQLQNPKRCPHVRSVRTDPR